MNTHADRWPRAQRSLLGAALAAASVFALAGCGTSDAAATQPNSSVGATANGNPPPPSAAVSATKFSRLPDPTAPAMTKVKRGAGSAPKSKVNAAAQPFTKAVSYSDGVVVSVSRIAQSTESGSGPGVFPGRPNTTISLRLKNGTSRPLNLTQVVVSARYGKPARLAPAVYNGPAVKDFAGTLAAGDTASASYVFSVPPSSLNNVVVSVDFDTIHGSALFKGAAK